MSEKVARLWMPPKLEEEIDYNATTDLNSLCDPPPGPKQQKKGEMAPLFYFLASSLNVELVYIILKSITQFQYICMAEEALNVCPIKLGKVQIVSDPDSEDVTLELKKIKIPDSSKWDVQKADQFEHDERCVTEPLEFETMDDLI